MEMDNLLSPEQAAIELFGDFGHGNRKKMYRWLQRNTLAPYEASTGQPILRDGRRYLIPRAIIKAVKGEVA